MVRGPGVVEGGGEGGRSSEGPRCGGGPRRGTIFINQLENMGKCSHCIVC